MKKVILSTITVCLLMSLNACTETSTPKPKQQATNNTGWVEAARSSDGKYIYEFNIRSYSESKKYVSIISQTTNIKYSSTQVSLERQYISKRDCKRGVGRIITKSLDGKVLYKNDFVRNGSSIASGLGDALCYMYALNHR